MIAGKDRITKTGLSAMLTKAKKNPAPITVPTPVPTLSRSGPSSEAAIQSPKTETDQRTPNLTRKYCICLNCIKGVHTLLKGSLAASIIPVAKMSYLRVNKYLAIVLPVLSPSTLCNCCSSAANIARREPNCLISFLRVTGPMPGMLSSKLVV